MAEQTPETDPLPPLREVIRDYDLRASKSFGQNFILDLNVTRRIARAAAPLGQVIEIGPGPGGLTRGLLMEGAAKVTVIEADERFLPALEDIAAAYPGRLEIVIGDALKITPAELLPESTNKTATYKIVANLPYNVATPLLINWLTETPIRWESLTLMFQKEVGDRICARPGEAAYGRLGVLSGWLTEAQTLFDVPASVFVPPPKVTSSIVQLIPRPTPLDDAAPATLEKLTAAAFGQRRKMLRASLKQLCKDPTAVLEQVGIDPTRRAETLEIQEFCALARVLNSDMMAR